MSSKFEFPSICGYLREQEIVLKCVLFTELTKVWGLFGGLFQVKKLFKLSFNFLLDTVWCF